MKQKKAKSRDAGGPDKAYLGGRMTVEGRRGEVHAHF